MAGYEFHIRTTFYCKWFQAWYELTEDGTVMHKYVGVTSLQ